MNLANLSDPLVYSPSVYTFNKLDEDFEFTINGVCGKKNKLIFL